MKLMKIIDIVFVMNGSSLKWTHRKDIMIWLFLCQIPIYLCWLPIKRV